MKLDELREQLREPEDLEIELEENDDIFIDYAKSSMHALFKQWRKLASQDEAALRKWYTDKLPSDDDE